jgi:SAM-dependent methyltransferase
LGVRIGIAVGRNELKNALIPLKNPLTRFSDRVEDYVKYRPGYPPDVIEVLRERCGLMPNSVVADIGSGPGALARLFLEYGNEVFAVEPNAEMRNAGQQLLGRFDRYHSVDGAAETTHLDPGSVDFVTAAQAFHWFDWPRAKAEFQRILRPAGYAVLLWNDRRFDSPFERDYEQLLLDYGTDYSHVKERGGAAVGAIREFFSGQYEAAVLCNRQVFEFEGLRGRLFSASYAPKPDHPNHSPMLSALEDVFHKHAADGKVTIEYDTNMYFGNLR